MASLLNCTELSKSFGANPLFTGISLNISEGERIGVLGPNGAGKSTLLKIVAGLETPDDGEVTGRRDLRLAYLAQDEEFVAEQSIREVLSAALAKEHFSEEENWARIGEISSVIGFEDIEQKVGTLSGGWRKRLAIATQIILHPEILLLDEPTNHLDLEGITWLEDFIRNVDCAVVIISHDRALLENVTTRIFEINRIYPQGSFTTSGNYSRFLEKREEYLQGLARYEDSLRNKVRREIEWLRRGPKARATKAKGRINEAERMITELSEYESRSNSRGMADIDFSASKRKTKQLIAVENVSKELGDRVLFKKLKFVLSPEVRIGVVGANGSGKSTLLKILAGTLETDSGLVTFAPNLKIVKFEQNRDALNKTLSLKKTLAPDGDSVVYRDREIHVASWAKRFLFRSEQLVQPVQALSGGEQARLLIAKLMLQPADVLLLDEPTNDLDIDTLQVLEESIEEFPGAVVLVTHDRFMLDRVSTAILGLDGKGNGVFFASYAQWEEYKQNQKNETKAKSKVNNQTEPIKVAVQAEKRLSYEEQKELNKLVKKIEQLEAKIKAEQAELCDPIYATDATKLRERCQDIAKKERELAQLMDRWTELESKTA